ncbi:hypothetical protein L596_011319 [Steinernema carpocapsae]|uniref:SCP domain-containing protein n=1 Tax=Steinernema carpocapsae TaxID=34508 RepID=A0A4U5NUG7_STECR|nr:hypothetical protein L596_011319 [Steinernema carpocapsae]
MKVAFRLSVSTQDSYAVLCRSRFKNRPLRLGCVLAPGGGGSPSPLPQATDAPAPKPPAETEAPEPTKAPAPTEAPEPTKVPTASTEAPTTNEACSTANSPLTTEDRKKMVDKHNALRSSNGLEASGNAGGKAPNAKNMYKMKYSCKLEAIAWKWADRCKFEHSDGDPCENLYVTYPYSAGNGDLKSVLNLGGMSFPRSELRPDRSQPAPLLERQRTREGRQWQKNAPKAKNMNKLKPGSSGQTWKQWWLHRFTASKSWWAELPKIGIIQYSSRYIFTRYLTGMKVGHYTQMTWDGQLLEPEIPDPRCMQLLSSGLHKSSTPHFTQISEETGLTNRSTQKPCCQNSDCATYPGSTCSASESLCMKR